MWSLRAPLFSVSLVFATGCLLALDGVTTWPVALALMAISGGLWLASKRSETVSLVAFYVFTLCAGLAHTLLLSTAIAPDDLRVLPEEKTYATTQWRGLVTEEPTHLASRTTRRALDRTSFVLSMEAWRPTGGRLFAADIAAPWQPAQGEVRCILIGPTSGLRCGDRIEFATALTPVLAPLNPGELDYRAWEAAQGIYFRATITPTNWRRVATNAGSWWQAFSYRARDWAYGRLQLGLEDDPRMADFLAGMLIGYRQQIPVEIEQDFRRTGTLHVFAVSGQNIAELLVVATILLQLCGLVRWRWAFTLAPLVLVYCLLTGSPSSAVRATVMALTVLLAWRLGRPLNALGCWSLALLAMLIWQPSLLLDPGAQLSFGVVLGLVLIAPPLARWFMRPFHADPFIPPALLTKAQKREKRFWWGATALLGASIAAAAVSEPITAVAFHQVTPVSIFANLIVVPIAGLITVVGTISVASSLLSPALAALCNNANWLLATLLIRFVGFLADQPGAAVNVPDFRALISPTPAFLIAPVQDSACLLVRTGSEAWLFNTGRELPARSTTGHLLQFYGINRLEGLVLAQMSVSDNSGVEALVRDFQPRRLIAPVVKTLSPVEKLRPDLEALNGGEIEPWRRGERCDLGHGVTVEALGPAEQTAAGHAEDRALVLLFRAGGQTLLWAGKISPDAQEELRQAYPGLRAEVLVMNGDFAPAPGWLEALGVREWLRMPPRDRQVNAVDPGPMPATCRTWRLEQTGAVEVRFQAATGMSPGLIFLRPWVKAEGALP